MPINTELCLSDATSGFTRLCGTVTSTVLFSLIHLAFKLQAGVGLSRGAVYFACGRLREVEQPKSLWSHPGPAVSSVPWFSKPLTGFAPG